MKKFKFCMVLTVVLAGALITGCAAGGNSAAKGRSGDFLSTVSWDAEYDVVVIGFGGGGAASAITAADAGARVLLLEKAPEGEEGGNTRYAAQLVLGLRDRAKGLEYYKAMRGNYDNQGDDVIQFIVDGSMANFDWIVSLGADKSKLSYRDYIEYPEFKGAEGTTVLTVDGEMWTSKFWKLLRKNVIDRSNMIDIWYSSPAVQLIQDKESRIVHGVKVENSGKIYNVRAINGVVMAPGGFENNDEMLENYAQLANATSKGAKYNTGDGIKMAIDVGADLWHMSALSGPDVNFVNPDTGISPGYYYTTTVKSAAGAYTGFGAFNTINVGGNGARFMDETVAPRHGHVESAGTWFSLLVPQNAWCIFDETARNTVPVYPAWSKGMVDEIAKGWIVKANTIRELAEKMSIDPAALAKTVTTYNQYCAQGNDPDFHVDPKYLKPIATGPFYAFPIQASLTNTQGGAKRNVKCEVIDVWGNPIPHLYSAGEFGSFYTDIYNGGGNLGECGFTGREAGKNAATVKRDVPASSVMENKETVDFRPRNAAISAGSGEYLGIGSGIGGDLTVKVKMEGDRIDSVEVVKHNETVGIGDRAVEAIPRSIVIFKAPGRHNHPVDGPDIVDLSAVFNLNPMDDPG
ncbi:FAD-binding dehydrogenase [Spirochaetia bacterium]|nr:FAD-binding dehydrogenase [Spirochaetia bacterium]